MGGKGLELNWPGGRLRSASVSHSNLDGSRDLREKIRILGSGLRKARNGPKFSENQLCGNAALGGLVTGALKHLSNFIRP